MNEEKFEKLMWRLNACLIVLCHVLAFGVGVMFGACLVAWRAMR